MGRKTRTTLIVIAGLWLLSSVAAFAVAGTAHSLGMYCELVIGPAETIEQVQQRSVPVIWASLASSIAALYALAAAIGEPKAEA